jgi:hypothetical protein
LLGEDYPGYFEVGDTRGLARLLGCAETDAMFLARLRSRREEISPLFEPARERQKWADLLDELKAVA